MKASARWSHPAPEERMPLKATQLARCSRKERMVLNRNELIVLLLHTVNRNNMPFYDISNLLLELKKKKDKKCKSLGTSEHKKKAKKIIAVYFLFEINIWPIYIQYTYMSVCFNTASFKHDNTA